MRIQNFIIILFCLAAFYDLIQSMPIDPDIMIPSTRLHQGANILTQSNNNFPSIMKIPRFRRRSRSRHRVIQEKEPETVYVNMRIDSEEQIPETKYVYVYIS